MHFKKYRKLYIVAALFLLALILSPLLDVLLNLLMQKFGIWAAVLVGYFYSFSFTGGATSIMLANVEENFLSVAIFAAFGAMLADLTILKVIKFNFKEEVEMLFKFLKIDYFVPNKIKPLLAFLVIGSPLPDEIGVLLLSQTKKFPRWKFLILCFTANLFFIYSLAKFL